MIAYIIAYVIAVIIFNIIGHSIFPPDIYTTKAYAAGVLLSPVMAILLIAALTRIFQRLFDYKPFDPNEKTENESENKATVIQFTVEEESKSLSEEQSQAPEPEIIPEVWTPEKELQKVDNMEGLVFEEWCADLFRRLGYTNVSVTKASGDQGVDVIAHQEETRFAIQCKCYSSDLGNTPIQEVNAGKSLYNCDVAMVVTNRYFTAGAKELAKVNRVQLWDRDKLLSKIREAYEG